MFDGYKQSIYNIMFMDAFGELILYNTLNGAILRINKYYKNIVCETLDKGNCDDSQVFDLLYNQGFLKRSDCDEMLSVINDRNSAIKNDNVFDIIILSTLQCNFKCVYCYETRRNEFIDEKISIKIEKLLENISQTHGKIRLSWYGGEPLCNVRPIVQITDKLNRICIEKGIKSSLHMTTNGYLIDENIDVIRQIGLNSFQITIDGNREHHNASRPLADGKGTYDKIIGNIKKLLEDETVNIILRMNFNGENIHDVSEVLEEFDEKYRNRLTLNLEPIFGDSQAKCNIPREELINLLYISYENAIKMGYKTLMDDIFTLRPRKKVYCTAEMNNQIVISPSGNLFKCSVCQFMEEERFGYIDENGEMILNDKIEAWNNEVTSIPMICKTCKYYPLCMSSCKHNINLLHKATSCRIAGTIEYKIKLLLSKQLGVNKNDLQIVK